MLERDDFVFIVEMTFFCDIKMDGLTAFLNGSDTQGGKKEDQAYSDASNPKCCFLVQKPVECPCLRKGNQEKSRQKKPPVHKIPTPSYHEKSMKQP